ncbi:hypothetical protein DFR52_101215 [Hoeflea marina]|uniref:Sulfotransferase family protein n=1 Tax=Hoeflea marina TaxID=274592 RepID=A0A317PSF0_9HYPH|nr:hypothetical protein [Hoeflea marina]PWW03534.1 hypothetical protein DFR52_101215 [Hoeflea marina]
MQVVIHGGMHKTGTTALQLVLHVNRQRLAENGYYCPATELRHNGPVLNTRNPDWSRQDLSDIIEAARKSGAHTLLLSGETVSTLSGDQFRQLREVFVDCEVRFIFCVRHWSSYLPSRWAQYCKRRDSQTFARYVGTIANRDPGHIDIHFDKFIDRAMSAGNSSVAVVSYDHAVGSGLGVVGEVLLAAGLPVHLVGQMIEFTTRANATADWVGIECARMLNGLIAQRLGLPQDDLSHSVGEFRRCNRFFDLVGRFSRVDHSLMASLRKGIETADAGCELDLGDLVHRTEALLNVRYLEFFTNARNGRVFPEAGKTRIPGTALDWQEFIADFDREASDAADQMGFA